MSKGGRCEGLTTLPALCVECFEIWASQPPGNLRACPGLSWDCFTFVGPVAQSVQQLVTGWTFRGSNPGGGEIFHTCPDVLCGPANLLYNGYRVFPRSKERPGRDTYPSPLLVSWSRKSRAIPLLPLWTLRAVQSLGACTSCAIYLFFYNVLRRSQETRTKFSQVHDMHSNFHTYPHTKTVHIVNSNSRTANCQRNLFSKKYPLVRIFCILGWLAVPHILNKWTCVYLQSEAGWGKQFRQVRPGREDVHWVSQRLTDLHVAELTVMSTLQIYLILPSSLLCGVGNLFN